jgi:hypothetical protein
MKRLLLTLLVACAALTVAPSCCSVPVQDGPYIVIEEVPPSFDPVAFEAILRHLGETCPLNANVAVQITPLEGLWGSCSWRPAWGVYHIQIDPRQPMHAIVETLIHEWAHAMVWDASQREEDDQHGPLWGVAQARAYRAVLALQQADEPETD